MTRFVAWIATVSILTILGLELLLQAGALFVGAAGRDPVTGWLSGNTRILALGDSNTYGLFLPAEQSYPAQFEAVWNAEVESPKVEVINLGYPGTNSSVLLKNLPDLLGTFRPDIVLVMVGVNDSWTDTVGRDKPADDTLDRISFWLRQHSRLYMLVHMIQRSFYDPEKLDLGERLKLSSEAIDAEVANAIANELADGTTNGLAELRYGDQTFDLGYLRGTGKRGDVRSLATNLNAIVDEIRREGAQPVLLTYPANQRRGYGLANQVIREAARRSDALLVDIAGAIAERCPDPIACPDLFFADNHAKVPGYAIAARRLATDLRASGLLSKED